MDTLRSDRCKASPEKISRDEHLALRPLNRRGPAEQMVSNPISISAYKMT
jgi:hypothetical protein